MKIYFDAILAQKPDRLNALLATRTLDLDAPDLRSKRTLLGFAAALGKVDRMAALLNAGAKVDILDVDGRNALSHAAEKDKIDALKFLLEKGADVLIKDYSGQTPLDYTKTNPDCGGLLIKAITKIVTESSDIERKTAAAKLMESYLAYASNIMVEHATQVIIAKRGLTAGTSGASLFCARTRILQEATNAAREIEPLTASLMGYLPLKSSTGVSAGAGSSRSATSAAAMIIVTEGEALLDELDANARALPKSTTIKKSINGITEMGILAEFLTHLRATSNIETAFEKTDSKYRLQTETLDAGSKVAAFFTKHGRLAYGAVAAAVSAAGSRS